MATDIWRRELEPLGIRTMTLVTTSVRTPAFTKVTMPQVSENSYYYVIRDYLGRLADGRLQDGGPTALECGLRIVREVEKGTTGEVWVGKDAGMNHWSWRLLPASIFVGSPTWHHPSASLLRITNMKTGIYTGWASQGLHRAGQGFRSDEDAKIIWLSSWRNTVSVFRFTNIVIDLLSKCIERH